MLKIKQCDSSNEKIHFKSRYKRSQIFRQGVPERFTFNSEPGLKKSQKGPV